MEGNNGYPLNTPEWKKKAVDWLYEEGLLSSEDWKKKIEEPLPFWAQAAVYQRLFLKLKGALQADDKKV
ncbi:hypothetical protein [Calidifontibacillus erzurumensis]|uniref:Uncharacterized protein n=1 Tax=Calidifontibacillus erzurumensis TaxID=2741433 RepID=A0A8J8GGL3_9BACI|nr:hypothetical protein [Calidifontibacillus erzurumensis]NSL51436.1 hypothetical protein [Calidifontibacillus erzurumensis]